MDGYVHRPARASHVHSSCKGSREDGSLVRRLQAQINGCTLVEVHNHRLYWRGDRDVVALQLRLQVRVVGPPPFFAAGQP